MLCDSQGQIKHNEDVDFSRMLMECSPVLLPAYLGLFLPLLVLSIQKPLFQPDNQIKNKYSPKYVTKTNHYEKSGTA